MRKILSFVAAMLIAFVANAQTDFASPGYSCTADAGVISGDAPSDKVYLDATADPHHIAWSDVSKTYTAVVTWNVAANRACYISVSLDLGPAIASNKHIFEVKLLDAEGKELGALEEGPAYTGDGFTEANQVKVLSGKLLIPAAGNYSIELRNNRDFCKGSIKNVILTYAGDAPVTDFAAPGFSCAADDGVITGDAPTTKFYLDESADPHHIAWSDVSKTYTAAVEWKVIATRACYVTVGLDLGPAISSNKHIFDVELYDANGNRLDTIAEGPAYTGDGFTEANQVKTLDGQLLIPEAGEYTIKLMNKRDYCKGSIKNVILTYAAPAPAPVEPLMKTIYCKAPQAWWKDGGAAVGCYTWDDQGTPKAAWPGTRMALVEGETDVWSIELDVNTYHMCIFTRMNPVDGDNQDWGAKTSDLTIPTDENDMYTITSETAVWGDPGVTGAWSKFEPTPQPASKEAVLQYTGDVTTNMVGNGANNAETLGLDANVFTVLADKGSNQNLPGLNKAHDIRLYPDKNSGNGNSIIVSIENGTIDSIALDIKQTATYVVKAGETAVTGVANVFAINGTSFSIQNTTTGATTQLQFNKITIYYTGGEAPAVAKPAIAGDAFFYDETEVTLTCATEGAAIYYTLDGTEPTAASTQYSAAFTLNASATVKAIAILGSDASEVAEKAFTKNPSFDSFEALAAAELAEHTLVEVSFENMVIDSIYLNSQSKRYGLYVTVGNKAYEIYYNKVEIPAEWEAGGKVSGTKVRGDWYSYKGIWELVPSASDWTWEALTYAADEPVVDPWVEIVFTKAEAVGAFNDSVFTVEGSEFSLKCIDTENSKHKTTANNASFGSLEDRHDYSFRLQTGGKSNSKNSMELNIPADGQLRIAVRTATSTDLTRTLVLAQGTDTIYNKVVVDTDTVDGASNPKIFNFVYADVKAGKVSVTYPINAINFYAFAFKEVVLADAPSAAPAEPTYASYQVKAVYSAKYNADCNFGEWSSGTQYTQEEYGKKYVTNNMGYFGLEFTGKNCSEMEALHLDVWAAEDIAFRVVPIHHGTEVGVTVNAQGQKWNAIDIPLTQFEGVTDWSDVYQIKIDNAANLTFWLNNVYFYTTQEKTIDLVDGYYLIGSMNDWDLHNITAADKFEANINTQGEYTLTTTLADGDKFKVVAVADNAITTWYPAEADDYVVDFAHAGEKTIYFRPDYQGGEGWHAGCIYVEKDANANPYETWFATGDTWETETESHLDWDAENQKATVYINVDKYGQWRAQVKYHGPVAEAGKCYHVALKMKANNAINNVTVKYQDNAEMVYVNDAALEANVEYVFDTIVAGIADGNGIMVLDFGFAHAGDTIEIYNVAIEEADCPEPPVAEVNYYLVGSMTDWKVVDEEQYLFVANEAVEGEYLLATTLTEGQGIKVVGVEGETQTWYPDGMGNEYVVDAAHAGEVTIYFRPAGNPDWAAFGGYISVEVAQGIENLFVEGKAVKVLYNGQILILKNNKMYTVMGQPVK